MQTCSCDVLARIPSITGLSSSILTCRCSAGPEFHSASVSCACHGACYPLRGAPSAKGADKWPRGHLRGENVHCGGLHRHSGATASEPGPSPPMCWFRRRIGVFWGHKGVVLRFHATLHVRKHDNIAAWPHVCEHDCFFWGSLFFVKSRLCIWAVVSVRERDLRARAAWCGC